MKATDSAAGFLSVVFLCLSFSYANAQKADTLKSSEVKQSLPESKPTAPLRFTPSLYFVPYYYNPMPVKLGLPGSHLSTTNMLLVKSTSTDNALNSINLTLSKDREQDKAAIILGAAFSAAVWGGVVNQAINGKRLSKEAQRKRAESSKVPVRR